jgi:uncharacterized protein (TIGR00299 family) protein
LSNQSILVIDAQMAGVAGDMFVAALIDLGAKPDAVVCAMENVGQYIPDCRSIRVKPKPVERSHVGGLYLEIKIEESYHTRKGKVLIGAVAKATKDLKLSTSAANYAQRAIQFLVEAEAKAHRQSSKEVHLHEAGSADTVVDIIGAATALDKLKLANPQQTAYYALPIAVGGGTFPSSHGQLSAPGPAVTEILTRAELLFKGGPLEKELATPTGAALIAALEPTSISTYPALRPQAIGYGAGTLNLDSVPNLLRLVQGTPVDSQQFLQDQVIVLETNVDDVPGEVLGYVVEQMMTSGAKDVTILPTITKKNRPGHLISVIASPEDEQRLSQLIITETGSLGVRVFRCDRHLLVREFLPVKIKIDNQEISVRVKISKNRQGTIIQIKPEYEDVKQVAQKTGQPLAVITHKVEQATQQKLRKKNVK